MPLVSVKTIESKPEGLVFYSESGLGKTTLLCEAVKASKNGILFECGESGIADLRGHSAVEGVPHYDHPIGMGTTQEELITGWTEEFKNKVLKPLMIEDHGFTTVAFDNFDNLINNNLDAYILKSVYNNDVKKANGWGGAKCNEMYEELNLVIKSFEFLQKKGISIILSFHSQIINHKGPTEDDSYKRWSLAIPARVDADLRDKIINWSSCTLFGTREVVTEDRKIKSDKRVLKTQRCAAYDAKCRYIIPETIDFSYVSFMEAMKKGKVI